MYSSNFNYSAWRHYGEKPEHAPRLSRKLLYRVAGYAKTYWKKILVSWMLIFLTIGFGLLIPLIFKTLIDEILPQSDYKKLTVAAVLLVSIPLLVGFLRIISRKINSEIGSGVICRLRCEVYAHLQRMSFHFFTQNKTGELMSRLSSDVVGAQGAITETIVTILTHVVGLVGTLIIMFALEWRLTIMGLVVVPLFMIGARLLGSKLRKITRVRMEENAHMNSLMNETLTPGGNLLIKLFGQMKTEEEKYANQAQKLRMISINQTVISSQFFVLTGLVGAIGTALVYWVGGHMVMKDMFSIGTIVAFSAYLGQLYSPLQGLTNIPVQLAQSLVSFERIFEIIDLPIEIVDGEKNVEKRFSGGVIVFKNVSFSYQDLKKVKLGEVSRYGKEVEGRHFSSRIPNNSTTRKVVVNRMVGHSQARQWALKNISCRIEPGKLVAFVGASGAGKSTLSYLIARLFDPTFGEITLDDHDFKKFKLASLTRHIGLVTQEHYLFHDTIQANLEYARTNATDEEIKKACQIAFIHEFISELPDGYQTIVGERGYRLSGGEKQRIALARVILKNPQILILDEATSHLDSVSEQMIKMAMEKLLERRTVLVIAHRLSTILSADTIFVLDRGQIIEQGSHSVLLGQNGAYSRLYENQFV